MVCGSRSVDRVATAFETGFDSPLKIHRLVEHFPFPDVPDHPRLDQSPIDHTRFDPSRFRFAFVHCLDKQIGSQVEPQLVGLEGLPGPVAAELGPGPEPPVASQFHTSAGV